MPDWDEDSLRLRENPIGTLREIRDEARLRILPDLEAARLWANCVALRYGLPPFVRLRPRPDGGYGTAGEASMKGDWQPTAVLFRRMLTECLRGE